MEKCPLKLIFDYKGALVRPTPSGSTQANISVVFIVRVLREPPDRNQHGLETLWATTVAGLGIATIHFHFVPRCTSTVHSINIKPAPRLRALLPQTSLTH
jgi:hypothetical protein